MCFNSRILSSIFLHTTGGTHKDPMSHAIYTPGKAYVASGIQPTSSVSLTGLRVPPHVDLPTQKPSQALLFHFGPVFCLLLSSDPVIHTRVWSLAASTLWLGLELVTVIECI